VLRIGNTTSGSHGTTALVKLNRLAGAMTDPELGAGRLAYIRADRRGVTRQVHVRTLKAGNRVVRYTIASGRLPYALGSPRRQSSAWASQALGLAAVVDPSSTGACWTT
jgi:hypothetical protein